MIYFTLFFTFEMEFFWPEKYRGKDGIDVVKMFEIVEERKEQLLKDLTISPQIGKAPTDLLTIYTMYEVFSIKGEEREETRTWFLDRYRNRLVYYLENKNSLPEYRKFLWNLFSDLFDIVLKRKIDQMDLDSYLVENDDISLILNIIGGGTEIKSWDMFKECLIKSCRKEFPYAEKRLDRVGNIKNFNKEIMDSFFKEKKEQFMEAFSNVINKDIEIVNKHKQEQINELKNQISISGETEDLIGMLDLLENGDGKIFIEISWMIRFFHIFGNYDFEIEKFFLKFYIREIVNRFQKSSDRRKPTNQQDQQQPNRNNNIELVSYAEEKPIFYGDSIRKISEEKESIINLIVKNFCLDEKSGKGLKKYLTRLVVNGKDCRMSSLKKVFGITSIDENIQKLFDELGIDLIDDSIKEKEIQGESTESDAECDEINTGIETTHTTDNQETDIEVNEGLDLVDVLFSQISKYKYIVSNEKKLKRQLEDLCSTDSSLKEILYVEIQKSTFGIPNKKKGRSYYTIEIGITGIRFLLFKCKDGRFLIDGVYNHDDYKNRVKEIN